VRWQIVRNQQSWIGAGILALALLVIARSAFGAPPAAAVGAGEAASRSRTATAIAIADLVLVTGLVVRGLDVRMVLLVGSIPLFLARGGLATMLAKVVAEMANPLTVVPIGSAMGFAFVLRMTECDQHLVQLLVQPLRRVRFLLIPGGVASGYLINTTIVSQAGTASVLGPILIPLLRASGLGPAHAGAVLLLGASMGGELFNPGAVEMRKLAQLTDLPGGQLVARSAGLNLAACTAALAAFWFLAVRRARVVDVAASEERTVDAGSEVPFRVSPVKALVPLLPLLILFVDPMLGAYAPLRAIEGPPKILAAMLLGVVAAGLTTPKSVGGLAPAFFEGTGYGYYHVISLIVAASTFAEGVRLSGLIELVIRSISPWPNLAMVVAWAAPCGLAVISGTGIAPAVAVMEFFVPAAGSMGLDPTRLGTVAALGAHFGRTMSPAAAVVMVSARLSEARPAQLIRQVAPPLLLGGLVLLAAAILGWL
jgi:DcuC family C4-dicarboxylate transporter